MEYPSADDCRIITALQEAKRRGWIEGLFGKQSIVLPVCQDDNDVVSIDSFRSLLPGHQQTNRPVGNVVVPGILNMDLKVEMQFEPPEDGKPVNSKEMSIRDILRKVYLKMGSRKIQVFFILKGQKHTVGFPSDSYPTCTLVCPRNTKRLKKVYKMNMIAYMKFSGN